MGRSSVFLSALFLACVFLLCRGAVDAARGERVPCLTAISAEQAGDSQIFLVLEGTALVRPEETYRDDSEICLLLRGVRFPAKSYARDFDTPLASRVVVRETEDGAQLSMLSECPMRLGRVRGAQTDRMSIQLCRDESVETREISTLFSESPGSNAFPSEKITLDVTNCKLSDIFRIMGESAGVNVLLDGSVKQSAELTLSFHDAPFRSVLQYVLDSQNLDCLVLGRTLIVGAKNSAALTPGRKVTKGYRISYADAQKAASLVKEMAELSSAGNKILVDERQNTLIVTATTTQHERVYRSLQLIDAPGYQVMLKARIIEVNDDMSDELETAINAVYDWWWGSYQSGELSTGAVHSGHTVSGSSLPNIDTSSDLPGTIGSGIVELPGTVTHVLDLRLNALVETQKARVVADPTVVVLDGEKATVKLVDKLKYVSRRDDADNPTYDDEEVGPTLEVTPRVGRNGFITVELTLSTGEVVEWLSGAQGEEIPQTNTRSVTTSARVRNGEPFVLGGLFKTSVTRSRSGVPVLQNIPLLGNLFKSRSVKKTRSQVVMILIPMILKVPERVTSIIE